MRIASRGHTLTGIDSTIARIIDHTLLRPEATAADIRNVCQEAIKYNFASVCVNPYWVPLVASELAGSEVKVCTVVGFPLGANATAIKVGETENAIRAGAQEIDMVVNIGELRGGNYDAVKQDIQAVVNAAHQGGAMVKVILETSGFVVSATQRLLMLYPWRPNTPPTRDRTPGSLFTRIEIVCSCSRAFLNMAEPP